MTNVENKRFRPIVDDLAEAVEVDLFTQDDIDHIPMATLYERSCTKLKTKVNPVVLKQLPTTARHHYRLMVLDCSGTYLGNTGIVALAPVVAACIRMTHLLIPRVGVKSSGILTLLKIVAAHPGLTDLNFAQNDLGTTAGKQLLKLVIEHKRISSINLHETLIIQPIKRKIDAQVELNFGIKDSFNIPLIPQHPDDEDVKQKKRREEEEQARIEREEKLKLELAEKIPTFVPAVLVQLCEVLYKHRENMENIFVLFEFQEVHNRFVSPKAFSRSMKIAGVQGFEIDGELRSTELADLFFSWRRRDNTIDVMTILDTLRTHAKFDFKSAEKIAFSLSSLESDDSKNNTTIPRQLLDRIYDARATLLRSFESIDLDETQHITAHELLVGIQSLVANCYPEATKSLLKSMIGDTPVETENNISSSTKSETKRASGITREEEKEAAFVSHLIDTKVNYVDFITAFSVSDEQIQPPAVDWMVKRSDFKALVQQPSSQD